MILYIKKDVPYSTLGSWKSKTYGAKAVPHDRKWWVLIREPKKGKRHTDHGICISYQTSHFDSKVVTNGMEEENPTIKITTQFQELYIEFFFK